jgi:CRISPR/Cas system CSM-associated protein Csm2 small subunit
MKKSELRKLIAEYKKIELKSKKLKDKKLHEKLGQIEHRYYHETGRMLKSDLEEIT